MKRMQRNADTRSEDPQKLRAAAGTLIIIVGYGGSQPFTIVQYVASYNSKTTKNPPGQIESALTSSCSKATKGTFLHYSETSRKAPPESVASTKRSGNMLDKGHP